MSADPLDTIASMGPDRLARLMTEQPIGAQWEPTELAAILRHQIAIPIEGSSRSFANLLDDPKSSIELLHRVRMMSKAMMAREDGDLPPEAAAVLYYASIALALLRLDQRITKMDDAALGQGIDWALTQSWVEGPLRELFLQTPPRISRAAQ